MHNGSGSGNDGIDEIARRSHNFGFLLAHEKLLVIDGVVAEANVYTEPDTAMWRARRFTETLARFLLRAFRLPAHGSLATRIDRLKTEHVINTDEIYDAFETIRDSGNKATHGYYGDRVAALECVRLCFVLGYWYHRVFVPDAPRLAFAPPEPPGQTRDATNAADRADLDTLNTELARMRDRFTEMLVHKDRASSLLDAEKAARHQAETELARLIADRDRLAELVTNMRAPDAELLAEADTNLQSIKKPTAAEREHLIDRAAHAARPVRTEREVREDVDRMLHAAGWVVQDGDAVNHWAGPGVAVREETTASGPADYLLYVDKKLVGVIEVKREGTPLSAVERQSGRYAETLKASQRLLAWRQPLPFRYETTSVETHFTNMLDPGARAREVFSFHRPETVARWMREADEDTAAPTMRAKLRGRLPALDDDRLWPAQRDAVQGLEKSLAKAKPRALIQMATGAGKTYTAVSSSYRLLKHGGAKRVLFLVDRNNLGDQALREFENYLTPDDGRKFNDLYPVQRLKSVGMLESSSVVICTVQRLYSMLCGQAIPDPDTEDEGLDSYERDEVVGVGYNPAVPPETFDVVIVDECHRSIYGLWRAVLEYFDAFIVGLTATPVAQTFGFFHQNIVSEYSYREAVADGVNVDFGVYRILTEIGQGGAVIPKGIVVPKRDRRTRRQRYEELDEDYAYSGGQIARKVISKGQLRLVLETFHERLFTEIFPPEPGRKTREVVPKTLIFAVDDNHAEEIVTMVREVFDKGNDFCQKITYKSKDAATLIKSFRNSPDLRIAVTVNMIATGTDIKPLECVFFLNEVKSWALFEQMKGRGARSIDPVELHQVTPDVDVKTRFMLVDAVGVTDSERVDASPLEKHSEKQISLEALLRKAGNLSLTLDEASTLGARLAALAKQIDDDQCAELEELAGRPLTDITRRLSACNDSDVIEAARQSGTGWEARLIEDACEYLADPELRARLLEIRRARDIVYDEVNPDRLIEARGVAREDTAERDVGSWREWVAENRDMLIALEVSYREGRNPRVVYQELKNLAARLARPPKQWTPDRLWEAYESLGLAAPRPGLRHGPEDLMGLIRAELGLIEGQPVPTREVVELNFQGWRARQVQAGVEFTEDEWWWLERLAETAAAGAGIAEEDLDRVPFTDRGGTDGFVREFGEERAVRILGELGGELTA
ncbi:type I restriction endonuclease subunit R [Phytomonospora endophytica]|uniref:Type I restriction enzyme R subunit n=1 Tax=Phytomonospora endophytica TaxID=714109 RepID=A0A841FPJ8_9ACTN|nr:DEAD/DEAH box helicase family protein [Phytomonospora endophytica]MBB6035482.1 type I restriction enzyme R subunit [Phytomonospora endophytica]GIG63765.1 type III restriction endonuclease subunit R [Phytomonospora endophytica]